MNYRNAIASHLNINPCNISDWFECGDSLVIMLKCAAVKDLKKRQAEIKLSVLSNE